MSTDWRQMAIKNTVSSDFWSTLPIVKNIFDCHLSSVTRGINKSQIQYGDSPRRNLLPCSPEINVHTNSLPTPPISPKIKNKSFLMFPAPPISSLFPCSPQNFAIDSYFPCNKNRFPLFPKPLGLWDLLAILMTRLVLCTWQRPLTLCMMGYFLLYLLKPAGFFQN